MTAHMSEMSDLNPELKLLFNHVFAENFIILSWAKTFARYSNLLGNFQEMKNSLALL